MRKFQKKIAMLFLVAIAVAFSTELQAGCNGQTVTIGSQSDIPGFESDAQQNCQPGDVITVYILGTLYGTYTVPPIE